MIESATCCHELLFVRVRLSSLVQTFEILFHKLVSGAHESKTVGKGCRDDRALTAFDQHLSFIFLVWIWLDKSCAFERANAADLCDSSTPSRLRLGFLVSWRLGFTELNNCATFARYSVFLLFYALERDSQEYHIVQCLHDDQTGEN